MPSTFLRRAAAFTATTAAVCALALSSATAASAAIVPQPVSNSATGAALSVTPVGSYDTGVYKESAAEIVQAYRDRLFVVNAQAGTVTVLDNSDPTKPVKLFDIASTGVANSVAVRDDGLGVIAFEATTKTDAGHLVFFDANKTDAASAKLGEVTVGALPDMVTFSKDGSYAVVANEGEPAADFSVDPEGSVSVIALSSALTAPAQSAVKTAGFRAFEPGGTKTLDSKVRVFGPDVAAPGQDAATLSTNRVSRNLEPEYITTDGTVAYVTLQENNAVATVDLTKAEVTGILPLGYKDWGTVGLDPSDKDGVNIRTVSSLKGLYMPDGIASYSANTNGTATTYLVTANEGDGREWGSFTDEARVKDLGKNGLGAVCATSPLAGRSADTDLGRLKVVTDLGKTADGCYSELYAYGGRSFSIWDTKGALVFDSGDQFEKKLKDVAPQLFNVSNDNNTVDDRSDDKGPEPENVTIGVVDGRTYAFIGLERAGGVMVYDITDPAKATYVTYVNNRNAAADVKTAASGDLGPEGITFVSALRSPTGVPLLVTGNEVSGTTTVFEVRPTQPKTPDLQILTINDFHGRLLQETGGVAGAAVLAGAVEKYRQQNPNTLFVSAGDNIGASAFESFIDQDTPTIKALKAATLDVSAVGNHEFDRGFADLTDRVIPAYGGNSGASSDFALGANVYQKGTKTPALKPYTIKQVGNTKVAFVGTVTPQTAGMVDPSKITTIEFGDETEAVNREAKNARAAGADIVIVLVHDGSESTDCATIATESSDFGAVVRGASADVNAIVSAHTHQKYSCTIGGRSVIQTGSYGTNLGTLDIDLDASGKLTSITPGVRALLEPAVTQYIAYPQAATAKIVADAKATADTKGKVEVGTITADITRAKNSSGAEDRGAYSTLGNTVADVYLWATSENPSFNGQDAQIAFMNPGGLRADLLYGSDNGSVSYREAANVQPFGNTLVTLSLTGAQLKQLLEQQWQPGKPRPVLALGVSKGFTFEYDPAAAQDKRIGKIQLNGKPIVETQSYRVVTNSFLAAGGDNFGVFKEGTNKADSGQIDLQATVDFFTAKKSVAPSPLGRAYLTGSQPVDEGSTSPSPTPTPSPTGQPTGSPTASPSTSASITASAARVEQGGSFTVTVSGLKAGEQLTATLNSTPIVITGIPAADASGTVTFRVNVPAALEPGAHTVVITRADGTVLPALAVEVVRKGALAATGAQAPWGIALAGGFLVVAGGLAFAMRRRRTA
ncbi:2',3'-cyclic-nucleotide 2'-phosphodiesterase (5'-nucleotidase family) [Microbacterium sp. 1154]|uniref:choice-of-anchor I family protein n=1 Tax=Microbacterium sp. 1154 TaxID=2817733 RepID=UPI0028551091|nr:choice-of-anchor I family protein [Microbacterium sp. 1154]MDR6689263.1 2',3'-cyclic-nucleotide 2'-phosphodiesterase (5'-nucleotidase family) [Microbacterium sp. 1154]